MPGRRRTFAILAAAVVIHDAAVLLLRRGPTQRFLPGVWGVPCGKIDFGESAEAAAARELAEETGLAGQVKALIGYSAFLNTSVSGEDRHNVQLNFLMQITPGPVHLSDEHDAFKWHSTGNLETSGADAHNLEAVSQALRWLNR